MGCGASKEKRKPPETPKSTTYPTSQKAPPPSAPCQDAPPPSPPSTRKEDIFKKEDYSYVDQHVEKMPEELMFGNFEDLMATLLSNKDWNDVAKIRAIFIWIASVDIYQLRLTHSPGEDTPMAWFVRILSPYYGYEDLLEHMCKLASIPCVKLQCRKRLSDDLFGFGKWNAVYVAGSWRFIDLHFACLCTVGRNTGEWTVLESDGNLVSGDDGGTKSSGVNIHRVEEFYFLTDPDQFIWDHFPDQSEWQLLKTPVTEKQFDEHYFVTECFFKLGLTDTSATKLNYLVETTDGETDFTFGLPEIRSSNYKFLYTLYLARNVPKERELNAMLDRFVMFEHREDLLRFSLRFPIKGKFKLEIYCIEMSGDKIRGLCCSYEISCQKAKEGCLPLPDCPPLGWGPNPATKAAGLKPRTHKEAKVVAEDGCIIIRLSKEKALAFHQMLKHHLLDEASLSKYSVTEIDGNDIVVYLRLPQKGEYALKLFAQELDEKGTAQNVLNYLVNCNQARTHSEGFPNITTGLLGRDEINSKEFGVKALSHSGGNLDTEDGKLSLDFEVNSNMMELVCEMHTIDSAAAKRMSSSITNDGNKWKFDLDMPVHGEYSLNVFARRKDDPAQVFHVHTYLIKSSGHEGVAKANSKATAVNTSVPTKTLETSDQEMMVPVPPDVSRATASIYKRTGNEAPDPSKIKFITADDKKHFNVKLKDFGEYIIDVYSVDEAGNLLTNVARYQINRKLSSELNQKGFQEIMEELQAPQPEMTESEDAKKQLIRDIKNAMKSNDQRELEQAIEKFLENGGEESDPLIKDARQQLEIFKARAEDAKKQLIRDIKNAMKSNDQSELEQAIEKFLENGGEESDPLIKDARQQLEIFKARAEDAKKQLIRDIKNAMKSNDQSELEQAIEKFLENGGEESDPLIKDARQQLEIFKARAEDAKKQLIRDIKNAMKSNDQSELEQAIEKFLENGGEESDPLIKDARQQLEIFKARAEDAKKQLIIRDIKNAMKSNDQRVLEQAIEKFLKNGGEESDPLIKNARQQLAIFKARAALRKACKQRKTKALDKAITRANKVNRKRELDIDIERAVRLRDHLVKMRKLRHAVLNMDGKTIAEIKGYVSPPGGVHQCLIATFLLLGHNPNEVKEWQQIQVLLGKTGNESLKRKLKDFDSKTVSENTAITAKETLSPYSKGQIRDVSAGAATFYVWAVGIIADVESYQDEDNTQDVDKSEKTRQKI